MAKQPNTALSFHRYEELRTPRLENVRLATSVPNDFTVVVRACPAVLRATHAAVRSTWFSGHNQCTERNPASF